MGYNRDVVTDRHFTEIAGCHERTIFEGTYRNVKFSGHFIECDFADAEFFGCEMSGTFERCEWGEGNGPW